MASVKDQPIFDSYFIYIDGRWSLEDLYRFPHTYEQVYFALEAIVPAEDEDTEERLTRAFGAFPWRGGYSAVSFYNALKFVVPRTRRPSIRSIQYSSPGWIELFLNQHLAVQVGTIVSTVAGSIGLCNKVYNQIHTDLQKRKLLRIEVDRKKVELSRDEILLVKESFDGLAHVIGLESAKAIQNRTDDPLIALKILLSFYRRIRILAEYKNRGKANFETKKKIR